MPRSSPARPRAARNRADCRAAAPRFITHLPRSDASLISTTMFTARRVRYRQTWCAVSRSFWPCSGVTSGIDAVSSTAGRTPGRPADRDLRRHDDGTRLDLLRPRHVTDGARGNTPSTRREELLRVRTGRAAAAQALRDRERHVEHAIVRLDAAVTTAGRGGVRGGPSRG